MRRLLDGVNEGVGNCVLGLGESADDTQHGDADNREELAEEFHGVFGEEQLVVDARRDGGSGFVGLGLTYT